MSAVRRPILDHLAADPQKALAEIAAERARRTGVNSFWNFALQAWPVVDQRPMVQTQYLRDLALHLEEAARGRILRLVGNGPPRNGKSNLFAIMWPAWIWTWKPQANFIFLSYSADLVTEHSVKCRALIESAWYQDTFRPRWSLGHASRSTARDNVPWRTAHGNRQDDFVTTAGGRRIAAPIKSGVTGRGADYIGVDDPLSAEDAGSASERETARRVIKQAVATRFNDPAKGVAAMLMQRVHVEDPSDWAVKAGWEHFCCPMEYDPERKSRTYHVVDGEKRQLWEDPRTTPGESLAPDRFPPSYLASVKLSFGVMGYAAQFNQKPLRSSETGRLFQRSWCRMVDVAPSRSEVVKTVRRWDLASTEGTGSIMTTANEPDWTVGVKLSLLKCGDWCVEDVRDGQWRPAMVRKVVKDTAEADGVDVEVVVPTDPGQAGKDQASEYVTMLAGYTVRVPRETGDKVVRFGPASAQAEAGKITVVRAPWNERFFSVLENFPSEDVHDDHADAFGGAVSAIAQPATTADYWAQAAANQAEEDDAEWTR